MAGTVTPFTRRLYMVLRFLMRIGVFPVTVAGRHHWDGICPEQGVIVVGNHETGLDAVYINAWSPRPAIFMCRRQLLELPVIGPYLARNGHLPVEPGNLRLNVSALAGGRRHLNAGGALGIHAAGDEDLHIGSVIRQFQPGAAKLAIQTRAPAIPAGIRGTRRLMPGYVPDVTKERPLRSWLFVPFRRVTLKFGAAVWPTHDGTSTGRWLANTREDIAHLTDLYMARCAELAGLALPDAG